MNWLLGGRNEDVPETPVHKWALNAFRGVLLPDTPYDQSRPECDTLGIGNSGIGILKTPGQLKDRKRTTVTFHASVKTPPKRTTRSELPNVFPGKFPSPWTPKSIVIEQDDGETIESPIGLGRGQSDKSLNVNPLKTLATRLKDTRGEHRMRPTLGISSVAGSKESRTAMKIKDRKLRQAEPLSWDVDQGFDEVLKCIEKNNAYLQTLINEMQESCSQVDESFSDGQSLAEADVTTNLDDPRSRSGQYWKAKFLEFNVLTECVKKEQNNMERVLHTLRASVEDRNQTTVENWKDRYDLLKEEFDRERRTNRNSAQLREIRDLKKLIKELQSKSDDGPDLRRQLDVAHMENKTLRAQLVNTTSVACVARPHDDDHAEKSSPDQHPGHSSDSAKGGSDRSLSSTSRRLAQARAQNTADHSHMNVTISSETTSIKQRKDSVSRLESRTGHRRFGSRTENFPIRQDLHGESTFTFNKTFERTGKDPSFSPPPIGVQAKEISPRPKFASLDNNVQSSRVAINLASKTTKVTEQTTTTTTTEDEVTKKRLAREAAQRRLDQRKAERALRATQTGGSGGVVVVPKENLKIN